MAHKKLKKLTLIALLTLLVGLGGFFNNIEAQANDSLWPMLNHDGKNTGRSTQDTSHVDGTVEWSFESDDIQVHVPPTIGGDGTLYVSMISGETHFRAINSNGEEEWGFGDITDPYYSAVGKDTVYVVSDFESVLYALSKEDGSKEWAFELENETDSYNSIPTIGEDGTIYINSYEAERRLVDGRPEDFLEKNTLQAINPDGTEKWALEIEKGEERIGIPSIGDDGTIYITSYASTGGAEGYGTLWAISPEGKIEWSYDGDGEVGAVTRVSVADDGTLYLLDREGFLHAINPDGTEEWTYDADQRHTRPDAVAIGEDGALYFTLERYLYAVDSGGSEKWVREAEDRYNDSNGIAIGGDGTIYFTTEMYGADSTPKLYAFDPDGTERFNITLSEALSSSAPVIGKNGMIYVSLGAAGEGGALKAIGGEGAITPAQKDPSEENGNGLLWVWIVLGAMALVGVIFFAVKSRK